MKPCLRLQIKPGKERLVAALAYAEDDPVVAKAKHGTRIAVRKTKQGTSATVRAVRSAEDKLVEDTMPVCSRCSFSVQAMKTSGQSILN